MNKDCRNACSSLYLTGARYHTNKLNLARKRFQFVQGLVALIQLALSGRVQRQLA